MKVSHTCTAWHITCQNPQWSKYINECLQLWASRVLKGKKKKSMFCSTVQKKKIKAWFINSWRSFFKKAINKTHGLNVRVAWSTSSSRFLLGLTPIEIVVTSQWWILVNFMALSKRNRWAVRERRYFLKKTHRHHSLIRQKSPWMVQRKGVMSLVLLSFVRTLRLWRKSHHLLLRMGTLCPPAGL